MLACFERGSLKKSSVDSLRNGTTAIFSIVLYQYYIERKKVGDFMRDEFMKAKFHFIDFEGYQRNNIFNKRKEFIYLF